MNIYQIALFEGALLQKPIDPELEGLLKRDHERMRRARGDSFSGPSIGREFRCPGCKKVVDTFGSKYRTVDGKKKRFCGECGKR